MSKLWPHQEAQRIIQRWPDKEKYILETGFGPSGHPHMGTVGEVVRTYYVALALKELGKASEIVVFSDDMDGLRKIPKNIDAPWLAEHLGKPVSRIPDPYGTCDSFSAHMNQELNKMLGATGIPYTFASSAECYGSGRFDDVLRKVFANMEALTKLITDTMRSETKEHWNPFQPACEKCGRVNTTIVTGYDKDACTVQYACTGSFRGVEGCGHTGEQSALGGRGKLGWKIDWPARWYALGVNYEMYGKDLIDSAKLGKEVVRILGGDPPVDMFYELFLTEEGRKMSKSTGEGMKLENWDRWGTQDSLNLLMFKNPRQQKKLGPDTVLMYTDESLLMSKEDPQYPFIYFGGDRPDLGGLRYSDITNFMAAVGITDPDLIRPYLERTFGVERIGGNWAFVRELVEKAANYYEDFVLPERQVPKLSADEWAMVEKFLALLDAPETAAAEDLATYVQNQVFEIAKVGGMAPKDYFKLLYGVLLGAQSGPRIGGFVQLLGIPKIKELIATARSAQ